MATTTSIALMGGLVLNVGSVIAGVIAAILALMAALIGLGWGVRKFQKHVSGSGWTSHEMDFSGGFKNQEEIKKLFPDM